MPEEGVNAIYLAAEHIGRAQTFEVGPAHPLMRKPTLNVGTISGGLNINSVPDYAAFTWTCALHRIWTTTRFADGWRPIWAAARS